MCKRNVLIFCAINVADSAHDWRKRRAPYETYSAARRIGKAEELSARTLIGARGLKCLRFATRIPTFLFDKVCLPVSCLLLRSARRCARAGFVAGALAIACCTSAARASDRAESSTGPAITIGRDSPADDTSDAARNDAVPDDDSLLAAAGIASGNVLQFAALSAMDLDRLADARFDSEVDLGPPRPAASIETGALDMAGDELLADGESVPAAQETGLEIKSTSALESFADADGAGHELWVVSTRNLPSAPCGCSPEFTPGVERFICGHGWTRSSLEEFVATDVPGRTTAVLVHGNDTDPAEAESRGREFYRELVAGRCPTPPTRLVVWSWPSEKVICSYRKDAQLKACRTNIEGYYLASFIDHLPAETPLTLGGYSYGARVVTGGLHLLGGGTLEGRELAERQHPDRHATNALLIGAAMANNWLLPGMRHEHAISQVERLVIMYNPKDFVLHFYPRLWGGRRGPEALGATGLAAPGRLGAERAKVYQVNVQPQMNRRHGWDYVSSSPAIMSRVRRELLTLPGVGEISQ